MGGSFIIHAFFFFNRAGGLITGGFHGGFDRCKIYLTGHVAHRSRIGAGVDGCFQHAGNAKQGIFNKTHARGAVQAGCNPHPHFCRAHVVAGLFDRANQRADLGLIRVISDVRPAQRKVYVDLLNAGHGLQAALHSGNATGAG